MQKKLTSLNMNQGLLFLFTYFVIISKIDCSLDNPHHDFTDYCEMLGQDDIQVQSSDYGVK